MEADIFAIKFGIFFALHFNYSCHNFATLKIVGVSQRASQPFTVMGCDSSKMFTLQPTYFERWCLKYTKMRPVHYSREKKIFQARYAQHDAARKKIEEEKNHILNEWKQQSQPFMVGWWISLHLM